MNQRRCAVLAVMALLLCLDLAGQVPGASDRVTEQIERTVQAAGTQWAEAARFFCTEPRERHSDDSLVEPTKIFDNVYMVGRTSAAVYLLTSPRGIIMIDSGSADQVDSVLLRGMRQLNLDPASVKYVLITHGHPDHFGGAAFFQQRYDAHVVASAGDWNLIEAAAQGNDPIPAPDRDVIAEEGKVITLGEIRVTPIRVPGITAGALGYIFPVQDNGEPHVAALLGGTVLEPRRMERQMLDRYLESVERFKAQISKLGVDVELQEHPLVDGTPQRLVALRQRSTNANPFVVGTAGYGAFLDVIAGCTRAELLRRDAASEPR